MDTWIKSKFYKGAGYSASFVKTFASAKDFIENEKDKFYFLTEKQQIELLSDIYNQANDNSTQKISVTTKSKPAKSGKAKHKPNS